MIGIWILGDRLTTQQLSLLNNQDHKQQTSVILIESNNHVRQRPYHRQKLVLVWSAMRHFAQELQADKYLNKINYTLDLLFPLFPFPFSRS